MKDFLIVGNWKEKQTLNGAEAFIKELKNAKIPPGIDLVVCPSDSLLNLEEWGKTNLTLGAQDVRQAKVFKELGVKFCIIWHSEKRELLNETPKVIREKVERLFGKKVIPILCIQNLKELEELELPENTLKKIVACFEPAENISKSGYYQKIDPTLIQEEVEKLKPALEPETRLLYGGSVNPQNAREIAKIPLIGGFLVGHASLKFQDFAGIIHEISN
jgi:triosephosphate isomerase